MIQVRAPLPGDIAAIGRRAAETWVRDRCTSGDDFSEIINKPHTNVATIDGEPVAIGGFIDRGAGEAIAWSLVTAVAPKYFVSLCRTFRRHITASPFHHIEAHCFEDFQKSHRWVKCLGFTPINWHRNFTPTGKEFRVFVFRNNHGN